MLRLSKGLGTGQAASPPASAVTAALICRDEERAGAVGGDDGLRQVERGAHFFGRLHQIDTYFHVPKGRLKLREIVHRDAEGVVVSKAAELIGYQRPNKASAPPTALPSASARLGTSLHQSNIHPC